MFQDGFRWSPFKSGLLVIAVFAGNITIKPFTTSILRRFGFRTVLVTACAASGLTLALCAGFTAGTPLVVIALVLVVSGVFRSIGFTAYNTIVFADVTPEGMSNANTLTSTIQQLTMAWAWLLGAGPSCWRSPRPPRGRERQRHRTFSRSLSASGCCSFSRCCRSGAACTEAGASLATDQQSEPRQALRLLRSSAVSRCRAGTHRPPATRMTAPVTYPAEGPNSQATAGRSPQVRPLDPGGLWRRNARVDLDRLRQHGSRY